MEQRRLDALEVGQLDLLEGFLQDRTTTEWELGLLGAGSAELASDVQTPQLLLRFAPEDPARSQALPLQDFLRPLSVVVPKIVQLRVHVHPHLV